MLWPGFILGTGSLCHRKMTQIRTHQALFGDAQRDKRPKLPLFKCLLYLYVDIKNIRNTNQLKNMDIKQRPNCGSNFFSSYCHQQLSTYNFKEDVIPTAAPPSPKNGSDRWSLIIWPPPHWCHSTRWVNRNIQTKMLIWGSKSIQGLQLVALL